MKVKIISAMDEGDYHGSANSVARDCETKVNAFLEDPRVLVQQIMPNAYAVEVPYPHDRGSRVYFVHSVTILYEELEPISSPSASPQDQA